MKNKTFVLATAVACTALFATAFSAAAEPAAAKRTELTRAVIQKWSGHVDKSFPMGADAWSVEMAPAFAEATMEELQAAAGAKTFNDMNKLLLGGTVGDGTQTLGQVDNDLVFVPISPCRIADTRLAVGAIAANTVRSFDVTAVTDYAFQGGEASNCGGAGAAGSFAAAAINFTVVTPSAAGYITAFPFLGSQPVAATVNYTAGDIRGNYSVVKLDQGASANELSVYSFAQTHLVADLVGYYINPQLGAIDCVETASANFTIPANSSGTGSSPACASGYTIISGGCTSANPDGRLISSRQFQASNTHFCAYRNENVSNPISGVAHGRCCRLPTGR